MSVRRAGARDLEDLAQIHAAAFPAGWSAAEIAALDAMALREGADGMILVRALAGEAEILTLGVRPEARGRGVGARLVRSAVEAAAEQGALTVFLEVAEDNASARRLYARFAFEEIGRRRGYYSRPDGSSVDALILRRALNTSP